MKPYPDATETILSQRSGERTTRRSDGKRFSSRKRAVTPFAATMKSSMSWRGWFCGSTVRSVIVSPSKTARASIVSRSSAPSS